MKAREYLEQYIKWDKVIQNKRAEVKKWKTKATKTTGDSEGERVKASGSKQKMADAVNEYADIEAEILALEDGQKAIIKTIEQLTATKYDILYKHYIQGISLKEICYMARKSYSWGTTNHKKALKDVEAILKERGNNLCNMLSLQSNGTGLAKD